jgi:GR25 family glycosyltransferase involved in LPS biosynthesis
MIPNKETIERSHTSLSTIAYGISRSGAEKLLKSVSNGVKTSIDWFMINSFVPLGLKVFSIYPYIVYCYDITDTDIQCDYSTSQPKI